MKRTPGRRRTLAVKLTLAFLVVSVTGVALMAFLVHWATYREFERLVIERSRDQYVASAAAHYEAYGGWADLDSAQPRPALPFRPQPDWPQPVTYVLANADGVVVAPGGEYRRGDRPNAEALAAGVDVEVDGEIVGTVLTVSEPQLDPREQAFLNRAREVSLYAALGASAVALTLGYFLTRTLTRPLRAMTRAAQAMAAGDLEQHVEVTSRDELGELAESFNRMSADLARSNRARRQMTADIAHDLRTPLTVIAGYLEALSEGVLEPTPARFDAMYAESRHLLRLVEDLRTLSLADAGELPLTRQQVEVDALLKRLGEIYRHPADQKNVDLRVDVHAGLPPLEVDPERMVQVLGNLLSNALRHTPAGGAVTLGARASDGGVELRVVDTGEGIPPQALDRVFDRFYRVDYAREQNEGQSGLGLAIAKSIIEAHGGTVAVHSTVGKGTTFAVWLPTG